MCVWLESHSNSWASPYLPPFFVFTLICTNFCYNSPLIFNSSALLDSASTQSLMPVPFLPFQCDGGEEAAAQRWPLWTLVTNGQPTGLAFSLAPLPQWQGQRKTTPWNVLVCILLGTIGARWEALVSGFPGKNTVAVGRRIEDNETTRTVLVWRGWAHTNLGLRGRERRRDRMGICIWSLVCLLVSKPHGAPEAACFAKGSFGWAKSIKAAQASWQLFSWLLPLIQTPVWSFPLFVWSEKAWLSAPLESQHCRKSEGGVWFDLIRKGTENGERSGGGGTGQEKLCQHVVSCIVPPHRSCFIKSCP